MNEGCTGQCEDVDPMGWYTLSSAVAWVLLPDPSLCPAPPPVPFQQSSPCPPSLGSLGSEHSLLGREGGELRVAPHIPQIFTDHH